jgi:hypothetical protein
VTKLESFVQILRQVKTSDLVSYLCTGHDMLNHSIIARVVDDAYGAPGKYPATKPPRGPYQDALGRVIRSLSPAEENDVRAAILAVATEVDRRIPAESKESRA